MVDTALSSGPPDQPLSILSTPVRLGPERILITGPFQSGKTTLLNALKDVDDVVVVEEAAREMLAGDCGLRERPEFQQLLYTEQMRREEKALQSSARYALCDRGFLDIVVHCRYYGLTPPEEAIELSRSYRRVYFCDPQDVRAQNPLWPEAGAMGEKLAGLYVSVAAELGIETVRLTGTASERLHKLVSELPGITSEPRLRERILAKANLTLPLKETDEMDLSKRVATLQQAGRQRLLTEPESREFLDALRELQVLGPDGILETLLHSRLSECPSLLLDTLRETSLTVPPFILHFPKIGSTPSADETSAALGIIRSQGKILAIRNARGWDLPGGHQEKGEHPEATLKREILEEASVTIGRPQLVFMLASLDDRYASQKMAVYLADEDARLPFMPAPDSFEREYFTIQEFRARYLESPSPCKEFLVGRATSKRAPR